MYFRGPRDILWILANLDNKQFAGLLQPHPAPEQTPGGFSLLRLSFPDSRRLFLLASLEN